MSGMLFLLFVQSMFQFGQKGGNERAITGRKIILTYPLMAKFALNLQTFKKNIYISENLL